MGDWKSKLPDLKEVIDITVKLAKDIKTSVGEIVDDYKKKHPDVPDAVVEKKEEAVEKKEEGKKVEAPTPTESEDKKE